MIKLYILKENSLKRYGLNFANLEATNFLESINDLNKSAETRDYVRWKDMRLSFWTN